MDIALVLFFSDEDVEVEDVTVQDDDEDEDIDDVVEDVVDVVVCEKSFFDFCVRTESNSSADFDPCTL